MCLLKNVQYVLLLKVDVTQSLDIISTYGHLADAFSPKRLTVTDIHTHTAVAAMGGADEHIRGSLGFSILPKDTSTCRPGESNQP